MYTLMDFNQKWQNEIPKKYHTIGTVPKYNRTIVERETDLPSIPLTYIHVRSFTWLHVCMQLNKKWQG